MPIRSYGPQPADILIVGEAPGEQEDAAGVPFVGTSGTELKRMLAQAGIEMKTCRLTTVFLTRPPNNKIETFCGKRAEVGKTYSLPPLAQGQYVLPEHLHELERLKEEIAETRPKLILALGNTPTWALLQRTGIGKLRGAFFELHPSFGLSIPVLPTFHPAYILQVWSNRVICVGDFLKAVRFLSGGIKRLRRELWLEPTLDEVRDFLARFVFGDRPRYLSCDIETAAGLITCIGFAPSPLRSITVPFYDPRKRDGNYWADPNDELAAWLLCREVLESDIPKLGQNFLYDIQYLRAAGISPRAFRHDTMIRHHSLHPELEKGLGFMASVYTDEAAWKVLRDRNKDNFKLDDE